MAKTDVTSADLTEANKKTLVDQILRPTDYTRGAACYHKAREALLRLSVDDLREIMRAIAFANSDRTGT